MNTLPLQPWYRQRWPWLLMIAPACAVLGGAATLWLSIASYDGLVADDYYKQGMAINRTLTRERQAHAFALRAQLMFTRESGLADGRKAAARLPVRVQLTSAHGAALPEMLRLRIVHPTRAGSDQNIELHLDSRGEYVGTAQSLEQGRRTLVLEDAAQSWRLTGAIDAGGALHAVLSANP